MRESYFQGVLTAAFIFFTNVGIFAVTYADALDEAAAAYKKGDYATALKALRILADQGNGNAQYNLGHMYANGHGVEQDYEQAIKWYRQAADKGFSEAQHKRGYMYAQGRGVTLDYKEAVKWYRKAAKKGVAKT